MRIALSGAKGAGLFVLLDKEDYEKFKNLKIWARPDKRNIYAATRIKGKMKLLHRVVMKARKGQILDHINRNGLDNRKANLRFVTHQQNCFNSRPRRNTSSRFKGVEWESGVGKWRARLTFNKRTYFLGRFDYAKDAAKAYEKKLKELNLW